LNQHDPSVVRHSISVAIIAVWLAERAGLPDEEIEMIRMGALLHDIGKVFVPSEILFKEERPTLAEWMILKEHAPVGSMMLRGMGWAEPLAPMVESHHERWDGTGYPQSLIGSGIPIGARIIALADALDAMTSDRCYREAMEFQAALVEIAAQGNSQFDPGLVEVLLSATDEDWVGMREAASLQSLSWALGFGGTLPARPAVSAGAVRPPAMIC
jgi:putative nucleotidyltransferase with HDIG domain